MSPSRRDPLRPKDPSALWVALFSSGQWDTLLELLAEADPESPAAGSVRARRWRTTRCDTPMGDPSGQLEIPFGPLLAHLCARHLFFESQFPHPSVEAFGEGLRSGLGPAIVAQADRLGLFEWGDPNPESLRSFGWSAAVWIRMLSARRFSLGSSPDRTSPDFPFALPLASALRKAGMPLHPHAIFHLWSERSIPHICSAAESAKSSESFDLCVRLALEGPDATALLSECAAASSVEGLQRGWTPSRIRHFRNFSSGLHHHRAFLLEMLSLGADPLLAVELACLPEDNPERTLNPSVPRSINPAAALLDAASRAREALAIGESIASGPPAKARQAL